MSEDPVQGSVNAKQNVKKTVVRKGLERARKKAEGNGEEDRNKRKGGTRRRRGTARTAPPVTRAILSCHG